jgi:hypothetical protein
MDGAGDTTLEDVSELELIAALDSMARGNIEYVIIENGDEFLQTAGEGAGPYAIELRSDSGDHMLHVPGGVDVETMRAVLLAYRRGDLGWRGALEWGPLT